MKWHRILMGVFCVLLTIFPFFPKSEKEETNEQRIITIWNVDTFEGGRGSRTSFLESVGHRLEQSNNVFFMVTSHTKESAERQFQKGIYPDILSCGMGMDCLPSELREAVPWCHGYYFFFCMKDDFQGVSSENTVVSLQNNTAAEVAARLSGLEGTLKAEPSLTAYVRFLNGTYRYLLGTQRDYFRLRSRGENCFLKPVECYSDLYQFVTILTNDESILPICKAYTEELLSDAVQESVSSIGMFSGQTNYEESAFATLRGFTPRYTLPFYVSKETIRDLKEFAIKNEDENFIKNYLKGVDS